MPKPSHSGPTGQSQNPGIRAARGPSGSAGPTLGWNSRNLLIWAITGWALASLLGILLAFHGLARRPQSKPEASGPQSSVLVSQEASPESRPAKEHSLERESSATEPETTTTTAEVSARMRPRPVDTEAPEPSESNDTAVIAAMLRHAAVFTEAGEFDEAIGVYDRVLERAPGDADFKLLRQQVVELRAAVRRGGAPIALGIRETPTQFVAAERDGGAGLRDANLGVSVRRATQAPEFPGELVVELRPRLIEPGDPYVLRVRLYNKGNRAIDVESLEVVRTLGARVEGRGQRNLPSVRRVSPRDTALLWEHAGTWREGQESGSVAVDVTLTGGGQLTKSISW